ncbi:hypothetical protein TNIN_260171 [Trichonephila inaurata madagascariensis]|uniref:Uncharacterized protein n=1 Tax=Trichonephila inaurata madagascariensis TaxID=2747483 RepID=A0A8X6YAU4_9ARAC|nr:hypothetical protein TNIN_260171 [Trichonephila inaurata madagascariensis]
MTIASNREDLLDLSAPGIQPMTPFYTFLHFPPLCNTEARVDLFRRFQEETRYLDRTFEPKTQVLVFLGLLYPPLLVLYLLVSITDLSGCLVLSSLPLFDLDQPEVLCWSMESSACSWTCLVALDVLFRFFDLVMIIFFLGVLHDTSSLLCQPPVLFPEPIYSYRPALCCYSRSNFRYRLLLLSFFFCFDHPPSSRRLICLLGSPAEILLRYNLRQKPLPLAKNRFIAEKTVSPSVLDFHSTTWPATGTPRSQISPPGQDMDYSSDSEGENMDTHLERHRTPSPSSSPPEIRVLEDDFNQIVQIFH